MTNRDILEETYTALSANKVRSGLTILGIVIGIASVIALVSIGQGAQNSITASIQSIGSNLLIVTPGAQRGPGYQISGGRGGAKTLTSEDAIAINTDIAGIANVAQEVSGRYQVTAAGTNTNTTVDGINGSYALVRNVQTSEGIFISDQDSISLSKIAVIGPTTRDDLFGVGADAIGQSIRINGVEFRIVGVTAAKGGSGFTNPDDMIYIPLATAQRFLSGNEYLTTIDISATDASIMTQAQSDITELLLNRHKIKDATKADFSVMNQADILASASTITQTLTLLLGAIAGISLLVGGIGIMNMMLTTVTERTREIGLRKAIGAKRHDINIQFIIEAVALTVIGGGIGVALGWLVSYTVTTLGILQASISTSSVFLAFGVSAFIGIAFGYYPARKASGLNPIEALRYE